MKGKNKRIENFMQMEDFNDEEGRHKFEANVYGSDAHDHVDANITKARDDVEVDEEANPKPHMLILQLHLLS